MSPLRGYRLRRRPASAAILVVALFEALGPSVEAMKVVTTRPGAVADGAAHLGRTATQAIEDDDIALDLVRNGQMQQSHSRGVSLESVVRGATSSIYFYGQKARNYISIGEDCVFVTRWWGRLGNNVLQFVHAVATARRLDKPFVRILTNKHRATAINGVFNHIPKVQDVRRLHVEGEVWAPDHSSCTHVGERFFFRTECENFTALEVQDILNRHMRPFLKKEISSCVAAPITEDEKRMLTIHVRSGDIWHAQPPCAFYDEVITSGGFERVRLVTDRHAKAEERNPCTAGLEARYPQAANDTTSFPEAAGLGRLDRDACALMRATNAAIGLSTFPGLWLRFNENLQRLYGSTKSDICGEYWWRLHGPVWGGVETYRYPVNESERPAADAEDADDKSRQWLADHAVEVRTWMSSYSTDATLESCPEGEW